MKKFRFLSFSQLKKLPQLFSKKEKVVMLFLAFCSLISGIIFFEDIVKNHIQTVPARGGTLTEGMVGSPRFINPMFADSNDVDRDLTELLFSGLLQYNLQGNVLPDLAENYTVEDEGKTISVTLKNNLKWSDGFPVTANDILFTIATLQDPRTKSPVRANWIGVEVEKVSDSKIKFKLQQPYAPFLERLTVKIIPSHIWQAITPENFPLSFYNIQAIGTGPYSIQDITRDKAGFITQINLSINTRYAGKTPFISHINFKFFETAEQLLVASKQGEIQSFSSVSLNMPTTKENSAFMLYKFSLPRYFALFFNLASKQDDPIKQKEIRKALSLLINRQELTQKLFGQNGNALSSPFIQNSSENTNLPLENPTNESDILAILAKQGYSKENGKVVKPSQNSQGLKVDLTLGSQGQEVEKLQSCLAQNKEIYPEGTVSGSFGSQTKQAVIKFQEKYTNEILAPQNLSSGTGKVGLGTRKKLNELCFSQLSNASPLHITITTSNQYPLKDAAEIITQQWEKFGIETSIETKNSAELERDIIKPRNYQVLLFGEILGTIPDLFPFWHSSQKKDPGLNLSSYDNKKLDSLLEQARKELDSAKRSTLHDQIKQILAEDLPAIILYNISYMYRVTSQVQGIQTGIITDPSQRFKEIANWYIKTKRVWK